MQFVPNRCTLRLSPAADSTGPSLASSFSRSRPHPPSSSLLFFSIAPSHSLPLSNQVLSLSSRVFQVRSSLSQSQPLRVSLSSLPGSQSLSLSLSLPLSLSLSGSLALSLSVTSHESRLSLTYPWRPFGLFPCSLFSFFVIVCIVLLLLGFAPSLLVVVCWCVVSRSSRAVL